MKKPYRRRAAAIASWEPWNGSHPQTDGKFSKLEPREASSQLHRRRRSRQQHLQPKSQPDPPQADLEGGTPRTATPEGHEHEEEDDAPPWTSAELHSQRGRTPSANTPPTKTPPPRRRQPKPNYYLHYIHAGIRRSPSLPPPKRPAEARNRAAARWEQTGGAQIAFLLAGERGTGPRHERAKPLIVDPGLYSSKKQDIFYAGPTRREMPTAFKLFTGSAWVGLSRDFAEYVVWGWDNLPRTLLMYYSNFISSPEGYFQTVVCNAPRFVPTVANHDLHHIQWDTPPRQHPHALNLGDMDRMVRSDAPFARKFARDDPVLDVIDGALLGGRGRNGTAAGMFVPGGWCGERGDCVGHVAAVGGADDWVLRPGPGAERLRRLMDRVVRSEAFPNSQCK